jgi:hypothetical protein
MSGTSTRGQRTTWAAGLVVAVGAGIATAHGLYRVAAAAHVPVVIGWLYPLITDGLALVAYAATSRLADGGRRYAWTIVAVAAGLSGLAQAVYLAGGIGQTSTAPVGLRFGVGAWPALAAALTAHLLHLIATASSGQGSAALTPTRQLASTATPANTLGAQPSVQPYNPPAVQPATPAPVQPPRTDPELNARPVQQPRSTPAEQPRSRTPDPAPPVLDSGGSAAGDRARQAARAHLSRHGDLPTATELMAAADVSRGTAGTVLKRLRDERPALHIVNANREADTEQ